MRGIQVLHDETRGGDVGLVAVLLEEHPLQHLGATHTVARHELSALREIPEDGIRFGQVRAVVELERRDPAVGIALQELGLPGFALVEVEVRPSIRDSELREQQPHLVAVAGIEVVEEMHRSAPCSRIPSIRPPARVRHTTSGSGYPPKAPPTSNSRSTSSIWRRSAMNRITWSSATICVSWCAMSTSSPRTMALMTAPRGSRISSMARPTTRDSRALPCATASIASTAPRRSE